MLRALLFDAEQVPDWRNEPACASEPPELFYPDAADHAGAAEARRICAGCPVRAAWSTCSAGRPRRHGIVGGLTPNGRDGSRSGTREGAAASAGCLRGALSG